jgi:hypothetical protein
MINEIKNIKLNLNNFIKERIMIENNLKSKINSLEEIIVDQSETINILEKKINEILDSNKTVFQNNQFDLFPSKKKLIFDNKIIKKN